MTRTETAAIDALRDKLASLETDLVQRLKAVETVQKHTIAQSEKTAARVGEMHDLLMQAKGAKWGFLAVIAGASTLTGFISWIAARWHHF